MASIEIDFNDKLRHRAVRFSDRFQLVLGSLSDQAAAFANIPVDEVTELDAVGASALVKEAAKQVRKKPLVIKKKNQTKLNLKF